MNKTFLTVPRDLSDLQSLRRFLERLMQEVDRAYGNRSTAPFATSDATSEALAAIDIAIETINNTLSNVAASEIEYLKKDGSRLATGILQYTTGLVIAADNDLVDKKYVTDNFTNNPMQPNISSLSLSLVTASAAYSQSEVQSIADDLNATSLKVDAILSALIAANLINI